MFGWVYECWWLTIRLSNSCGDCFSRDCGVPGPKHSKSTTDCFFDRSQMSYNVYMYINVLSHTIHVYGVFKHIWLIFLVNVGKYTIHGSYGYVYTLFKQNPLHHELAAHCKRQSLGPSKKNNWSSLIFGVSTKPRSQPTTIKNTWFILDDE